MSARTSVNVRGAPEGALVHPFWWCMLSVLLVNDHVLKGSGWLHCAITGKLSDVAGLVVAPMLAATLVRARSRAAWRWWHVGTGAVFLALKLSSGAASVAERAMAVIGVPASIIADPWDLLALPALAASWYVLVPSAGNAQGARAAWKKVVVVAAAGLGLFATVASSVHQPRTAVSGGAAGRWVHVQSEGALFVLQPNNGQVVAQLPLEARKWVGRQDVDWILVVDAAAAEVRGWSLRRRRLEWEVGLPDQYCSVALHPAFVVECPWRVSVHSLDDGRCLWMTRGETVLTQAQDALLLRQDRVLIARHADTGVELWRKPLPTRGVCVAGDRLFVLGDTLARLDPTTGREEATLTAPMQQPLALLCSPSEEPTRRRWNDPAPPETYPAHQLLVAAHAPLIIRAGNVLQAVSPDNLTRLWSSTTLRASGILAASNDVVVVQDARREYAIAAESGAMLWSWAGPAASASISHESVVLLIGPGEVRAFDARSGAARWVRTLE